MNRLLAIIRDVNVYVPLIDHIWKSGMKATIKDVARRAGVSIATVSRAINNVGPLREETRSRIISAIRELNYSPNAMGRGLVTSRTETLGVILPDVHGEFFSELMRGIDQAARARNYHIMISSTHSEKSEIESMLKHMRGGRVDGIIIMSPHVGSLELHGIIPRSLPVVLLNCCAQHALFDTVQINNFGGAYKMVKHLIGHGHERIAIIKGQENNYDALERYRGYRAALEEHGLPILSQLEVTGNFTEESGFAATRLLLNVYPRPTAIFASNDAMAIGAIRALHEAGLAIPEDVAIAGFDDIPMSRYLTPPLSSVHVPIFELGAKAVERLFVSIDAKNKNPKQRILLDVDPIPRESCCHPKG